MSSHIFVDRRKELADLEKFYEMSKKGIYSGLILYGWRKVGKSTLIDFFLSNKPGFRINCAWISDPETFCRIIIDELRKLLNDVELVKELKLLLREERNPMMLLRKTFEILNEASDYLKNKVIVALDEFHKFIDKMSLRIARETNKRKDIVYNDILWMLKDIMEKKKVVAPSLSNG